MKHSLTFILALCCHLMCGAQATSLTIDNQTPGWLSSKINYGDQTTVKNLTVTGYINQADLAFISDLMSKHNLSGHLNLTDVEIVDTKFSDLPTSGGTLKMFQLSKTVSINRFSIPKSLSRISPYLLAGVQADTIDYGSNECYKLTPFLTNNAYFSSNISPKVLILRDGVSKIDKYYESSGLTKKNLLQIHLPQTLDSIGDNAFASCENLSHINMPDGIHTIGNYAFAGTSYKPDTLRLPSNLKKYYTRSFPRNPGQVIIIPNTTESIDNDEYGSNNLNSETGIDRYDKYTIIINRIRPPRFKANYGPHYVDLSSCDLFVPKECIDLYKDLST